MGTIKEIEQWLIKYTSRIVGVTSDQAMSILEDIRDFVTRDELKNYSPSILFPMFHVLSYTDTIGPILAGHKILMVAKHYGLASIEPLLDILRNGLEPSLFNIVQKHGKWYTCDYQMRTEHARMLAATVLEDILKWVTEGRTWRTLTDSEKTLVGVALSSISLMLGRNIVNEWREDHNRYCHQASDRNFIKITEDAMRSIAELARRI